MAAPFFMLYGFLAFWEFCLGMTCRRLAEERLGQRFSKGSRAPRTRCPERNDPRSDAPIHRVLARCLMSRVPFSAPQTPPGEMSGRWNGYAVRPPECAK